MRHDQDEPHSKPCTVVGRTVALPWMAQDSAKDLKANWLQWGILELCYHHLQHPQSAQGVAVAGALCIAGGYLMHNTQCSVGHNIKRERKTQTDLVYY